MSDSHEYRNLLITVLSMTVTLFRKVSQHRDPRRPHDFHPRSGCLEESFPRPQYNGRCRDGKGPSPRVYRSTISPRRQRKQSSSKSRFESIIDQHCEDRSLHRRDFWSKEKRFYTFLVNVFFNIPYWLDCMNSYLESRLRIFDTLFDTDTLSTLYKLRR